MVCACVCVCARASACCAGDYCLIPQQQRQEVLSFNVQECATPFQDFPPLGGQGGRGAGGDHCIQGGVERHSGVVVVVVGRGQRGVGGPFSIPRNTPHPKDLRALPAACNQIPGELRGANASRIHDLARTQAIGGAQ